MAAGIDQHSAAAAGSTQLCSVLLCDLADSTGLVERLGDQRGSALIRAHDRLARDLLREHGGREIDKTDGFLALFERPIQAVAFALAYQDALKAMVAEAGDGDAAEADALRARVGIHVGEVRVWDNAADDVAHGAKPMEVEGLAKPVAARLMGLALPGQVLLSGVANTLALRAQDELGNEAAQTRWLTHGRYRFKGVPQPMVVHEVGQPGTAPLRPPPSGSKARRELPWYRTPVAMGLELVGALVLATALLWAVLRPDPAIAFAERDWVVVGELRNLTAEPLFDDALDTAFRIGLEQSRYINVLPDLQVRDALKRMQRQATGVIDRDTAIEVALREGARAVILPTVAEVGGRVRVSAEVVDPVTGVTVYGESADGRGAEAALPAMDTVLALLRARLGESLGSIEQSSAPLERVTTSNLEALRAYSLAVRAIHQGAVDNAANLLLRAIELDPAFATAHAKLAQTLLGLGRVPEARERAGLALQHRDRLPSREQLYVEAVHSLGGPVDETIAKWELLASLYPDFPAGPHNVGMFQWQMANRFDAADTAFRQAVTLPSPLQFASHYYRGLALLGLNRFEQAEAALRQAASLSPNPVSFALADLYAAMGRFAEADQVLATVPEGLAPFFAVERLLRRITRYAAASDYPQALAAADQARDYARRNGLQAAALRAQMAAVAVLRAEDKAGAARDALAAVAQALQAAPPSVDYDPALYRLLAANLAARLGQRALAVELRDAATQAEPPHAPDAFRSQMRAVVDARIALLDGDPGAALRQLQPLLDGTELVQVRVALRDAARATGDAEGADGHRDWLGANRGRAFSEFNGQWAAQALNVMDVAAASAAAATTPDTGAVPGS